MAQRQPQPQVQPQVQVQAVPVAPAVVLANLLALPRADSGVPPILPGLLSSNIDHLIRDFAVTIDTTGVVKSSMIISLFQVDGQPYPIEGNIADPIIMITTPAQGNNVQAVVGSSAAMNAIQDNDNGRFLRQVIGSVAAARTWILDLTAADQVRRLSPKNIEGYFMSKNGTKIIGRELLTIVDACSRGLAKIMNDQASRAVILQNPSDWVKYHTSATSTAGLVHRVKGIINGIFPGFFAPATVQTIDNANNATWDKALSDLIPRNVVAITYIWLDVAKQLPDDWYQGNAAIALMNPAQARVYRNFFRRYLEISADDAPVQAIQILQNLVAYQAANATLNGI